MGREILRCAQDDNTRPFLVVEVHYRTVTHLAYNEF